MLEFHDLQIAVLNAAEVGLFLQIKFCFLFKNKSRTSYFTNFSVFSVSHRKWNAVSVSHRINAVWFETHTD